MNIHNILTDTHSGTHVKSARSVVQKEEIHTHTCTHIAQSVAWRATVPALWFNGRSFLYVIRQHVRKNVRTRTQHTHTTQITANSSTAAGRQQRRRRRWRAASAALVLCSPSHTQPWGYCKILYTKCAGVELWYSKYRHSGSGSVQYMRVGRVLPATAIPLTQF